MARAYAPALGACTQVLALGIENAVFGTTQHRPMPGAGWVINLAVVEYIIRARFPASVRARTPASVPLPERGPANHRQYRLPGSHSDRVEAGRFEPASDGADRSRPVHPHEWSRFPPAYRGRIEFDDLEGVRNYTGQRAYSQSCPEGVMRPERSLTTSPLILDSWLRFGTQGTGET